MYRLYWRDTRPMLADGMTKGSVDREALIVVRERGEWHLHGDEPVRAQKFHGGEASLTDSVARLAVPPDAKNFGQEKVPRCQCASAEVRVPKLRTSAGTRGDPYAKAVRRGSRRRPKVPKRDGP